MILSASCACCFALVRILTTSAMETDFCRANTLLVILSWFLARVLKVRATPRYIYMQVQGNGCVPHFSSGTGRDVPSQSRPVPAFSNNHWVGAVAAEATED